MKKGNKKNRHFSKGIHRLKNRNRDFIGKESKLSAEKSRSEQLAEKSCKYNLACLILQIAVFLLDRVPKFIEFLINNIGMD